MDILKRTGRRAPFDVLTTSSGVVVLLCLIGAPEFARSQPQSDEYKVKAAFLFHFAQLTEWRPEDFGGPKINLCTFVDDPFSGQLEAVTLGKVIGGRKVGIRHVKQIHDIKACQILFVDGKNSKRFDTLLKELVNTPVLTVGEADTFVQQGGMIRLFLEDSKVRFEINESAADRVGLKLSSRLMSLARKVTASRHE